MTKNDRVFASSAVELNGSETVKRLLKATTKLVTQGTKLIDVDDGATMIIFIGRQGDKIVDIQTQFGTNIQQLIITALGSNDAFMIRINHQKNERGVTSDIEAFTRGEINPELRANVEGSFPRFISFIRFDLPTKPGDLEELTGILEMTSIDKVLLKQTVEFDTYSGKYKKARTILKDFQFGIDVDF